MAGDWEQTPDSEYWWNAKFRPLDHFTTSRNKNSKFREVYKALLLLGCSNSKNISHEILYHLSNLKNKIFIMWLNCVGGIGVDMCCSITVLKDLLIIVLKPLFGSVPFPTHWTVSDWFRSLKYKLRKGYIIAISLLL